MVENLAAFEYKTQEEVLTVIRHATSVLSVAGVHVIGTIQASTAQQDPSVSHSCMVLLQALKYSKAPPQQNSGGLPTFALPVLVLIPLVAVTPIDFSRTCTSVAMLLILKSHLKAMYGLTEEWVTDSLRVLCV